MCSKTKGRVASGEQTTSVDDNDSCTAEAEQFLVLDSIDTTCSPPDVYVQREDTTSQITLLHTECPSVGDSVSSKMVACFPAACPGTVYKNNQTGLKDTLGDGVQEGRVSQADDISECKSIHSDMYGSDTPLIPDACNDILVDNSRANRGDGLRTGLGRGCGTVRRRGKCIGGLMGTRGWATFRDGRYPTYAQGGELGGGPKNETVLRNYRQHVGHGIWLGQEVSSRMTCIFGVW